MKYLYTLLFICFGIVNIQAQEDQIRKTEVKGDLVEVSLFYETGELMQHGFYDTEGKLHGGWESYNKEGKMTCYATYDKGVKVGVWTYWNDNKITKVLYKENKIADLKIYDKEEFIKNEF